MCMYIHIHKVRSLLYIPMHGYMVMSRYIHMHYIVIERRIHAHTKRYQAKGHGTLDMRFNCTVKCAREWVRVCFAVYVCVCVCVCLCVHGLLKHGVLHIIISRSLTLIDQQQNHSPCPVLFLAIQESTKPKKTQTANTTGCACWTGHKVLARVGLGGFGQKISGCGAVSKCRWLMPAAAAGPRHVLSMYIKKNRVNHLHTHIWNICVCLCVYVSVIINMHMCKNFSALWLCD